MALSVGDLLQGRYRVGAPLGHGGMGSVFEAREESGGLGGSDGPESERGHELETEPHLAVKQLRLDAPELLESFRGEFAVLARISEPHLVRVIDFGSERLRGELHHYYVAERVPGETIATRVRRSPGADFLAALADAVRGLAALHDAGIRHGDFTPANVLIDQGGRGVLIDLGCARPFGLAGELAGTESFVAPELLAGKPGDARSDLYGIGRTLQVLAESAARPLPPAVLRLTERLLREDPQARPTDCREVLELLGQKLGGRRGPCVPARLLGRERELEQLEQWLNQLGSDDAAPRCLEVWGPAGVGVSRLLRELTWRAQLGASVLRVRQGESLGRALALALGIAEPISTRRGLLAAVTVLAERDEPLLLVVGDADQLDGEAQLLFATLRRALGASGSLRLAWSARTPQAADLPAAKVASLQCEPLPPALAEQWLSPWVSSKRARELARESGGYPGKLQELLAEELGQAEQAGKGAKRSSLPELAPAERQLLALFAAVGASLVPSAVGSSFAELEPLLERRVLERDGDELRLTGLGRGLLETSAMNAATLSQAHRRVAEHLAKTSAASPAVRARLVRHWVLAGELGLAEAVFVAERELLGRCERKDARLLGVLLRSARPELLLDLGQLLLEQGAPRISISCAARAARLGRELSLRRRALLLAGDALARLGRPARAELLLARQLSGASAAVGPEAAEVLLRLARARLARGDYAGAKITAEKALELGPTPESAGLVREVVGVACSYLGDAARAEQELEQALSLLGAAQRPRERCRIQSHRAMLAFRAGRTEAALADYAAALSLAEQHDFDDLIATGLLNLGTAEQQAGLWGEALRHYDRGVAFASAIGRVTTELTLEFNLANLYAEIGAFERAEAVLSGLEQKLAASALTHLGPSIALVRAEMALSQHDAARAEQQLLAAEAALAERPRELSEVRQRRVDLELLQNRPQEAERKLKALAQSEPGGASDLELGLELLRGRVDAALGRTGAFERLERARARAQREGLLALEATLEAELSRVAERSQRLDEARSRSERARRLWDRIGEGLPSALLSLFWRHERRRPLLEQSRRFAVKPAEEAGQGLEAYRRLLSLNRRLNSSLSLERVLEYAVQAALDLTEAERAFLLLLGDGAEQPDASASTRAAALEVTLSRSSDPSVAPTEGPSQSIVRRTLEREEAILTTDAQHDQRFWGQGSVHAMRLKSVLSVPILAPSGVLGVLYVDCRVQRGRFSEAERELLAAFADQLALAIGNARLLRVLEQKSAELGRQKHALEQLSRGKDREIERLKREVQSQRQNLELRYDYSQIVGRGPAMRQVLERLDRVVDSDASVLVLGESGTGKELVARALHWNGPRKAKPFMGINCAALPETLLESELFGHVRGAFTGADRDKQGLFLAAAGGTLFLDEIGELAPATQAKLLRVLQEREVRPLGAERAQPLDVRLVAATHRDLEQAIADGRFREDLYYRLAVVTLRLPPLRERTEDLPALAQRILERLGREAGRKPPELGQDALRRLSAHAFPGNVRELENVLTRAFVLSAGPKLRAEDLDLGQTRAKKSRAGSRRDFEADERERILTALRASRWNVSVVSRSLGIPRNTLYRKLERYGLTRTAD